MAAGDWGLREHAPAPTVVTTGGGGEGVVVLPRGAWVRVHGSDAGAAQDDGEEAEAGALVSPKVRDEPRVFGVGI